MKIVKPIYLTFSSATSNATNAKVHIPFHAKFARVVSVSYVGTNQPGAFFIESDMFDNQVVSIQNSITAYPAVYSQDVTIEFAVPKQIQGLYTFYLKKIGDGTPYLPTANDTCGLLVEFYDENSYPYRTTEKTVTFLDIPNKHI